MTLPLIYALSKAPYSEKKRIINIVKNHNTDDKKVKEVLTFVKNSGGLEYATDCMNNYQARAFKIMENFPESIFKKSLIELVRFTTERNH